MSKSNTRIRVTRNEFGVHRLAIAGAAVRIHNQRARLPGAHAQECPPALPQATQSDETQVCEDSSIMAWSAHLLATDEAQGQ